MFDRGDTDLPDIAKVVADFGEVLNPAATGTLQHSRAGQVRRRVLAQKLFGFFALESQRERLAVLDPGAGQFIILQFGFENA